jgi:hypothetical protein
MQTTHDALPTPLRLISPLALALAVLAPGCVLEITDFKESGSSGTTAALGDTEGSTGTGGTSDTDSGTSSDTDDEDSATAMDTGLDSDTDDAMTTGPGESPACHAYTDDVEAGDAEACAAELDCAAHMSEESCAGGFYNVDTFVNVGCAWGNLLTGLYSEEEQLCDGEITGVCRPAIFNPKGGSPCDGFYRDFGDSLELLNLDCHIPMVDDWAPCDVDGETDFAACDHCFPSLP